MNIITSYNGNTPIINTNYNWGYRLTMALVGSPTVGWVDSVLYYEVFGALQSPIDGFKENL
jgi:hypothetical protein